MAFLSYVENVLVYTSILLTLSQTCRFEVLFLPMGIGSMGKVPL